MPSHGGVSGLGVLITAAGAVLITSGIRDVSALDVVRSVARGGLPPAAAARVTTVSFTTSGGGGGGGDATTTAAPDPGTPPAAGTAGGGAGTPAVATAAAHYLGIPYRWGGKDPASGLDCSGLVYRAILDATGQTCPLGTVGQGVWSGFVRIPRAAVAAGDICWWPGHVVVATDNVNCISAPRPGLTVRRERIDTAGPVGMGAPTRCLRLRSSVATSSGGRTVAV